MADPAKLRHFLEAAGARAGSFYLLRGRGRVLAALPPDPPAFQKTLALYRPQRIPARIWVRLLRGLGRAGAQGLVLQKWSWPGAQRPSMDCPGVLLGNPDHPVPRAVFLTRENQAWSVGKFIPDPTHQNLLRREEELLRIAVALGDHAPRSLGIQICGQGFILLTQWVESSSASPSREDRVKILKDWLLDQPPRPLADFPAWKLTGAVAAIPAHVASTLRLRPSLRHGDFTPWNLLKSRSGTWVAVDWEEGCPEDAPGLDLVHDLLQEEFLIRRSSSAVARQQIFAALQQPSYAEYLSLCGWSGHEKSLLGWALDLEAQTRPEIKRWMDSR
jgi:hypothetical protein